MPQCTQSLNVYNNPMYTIPQCVQHPNVHITPTCNASISLLFTLRRSQQLMHIKPPRWIAAFAYIELLEYRQVRQTINNNLFGCA